MAHRFTFWESEPWLNCPFLGGLNHGPRVHVLGMCEPWLIGCEGLKPWLRDLLFLWFDSLTFFKPSLISVMDKKSNTSVLQMPLNL